MDRVWKRVIFLLLLIGLVSSYCFGTTVVTLKNGSIVKGEIVEHRLFEQLMLETTDGVLRVIPSKDIISIDYYANEEILFENIGNTVIPKQETGALAPKSTTIDAKQPIEVTPIPAMEAVALPEPQVKAPNLLQDQREQISIKYSFGTPVLTYNETKYRLIANSTRKLFTALQDSTPEISPQLIRSMDECVAQLKRGRSNTLWGTSAFVLSYVALILGSIDEIPELLPIGAIGAIGSTVWLFKGISQMGAAQYETMRIVNTYNLLYADGALGL